MTNERNGRLQIGLASGQELAAAQIRLFPESEIGKIAALRLSAEDKMSGFSAGVAFLGSPAFAIGSAAALNVVESMVSGKRRKQGVTIARQAVVRNRDMLCGGKYFPINDISHVRIFQTRVNGRQSRMDRKSAWI